VTKPRHGRPRTGFARSKQGSQRNKGRKIPSQTRQPGEDRPPGDNSGENATAADTVSPPAGRNFKQSIGGGESTEHKSHLDGRESKVAKNCWSRNRDADPVHIGKKGQGNRHGQYTGPYTRIEVGQAAAAAGVFVEVTSPAADEPWIDTPFEGRFSTEYPILA